MPTPISAHRLLVLYVRVVSLWVSDIWLWACQGTGDRNNLFDSYSELSDAQKKNMSKASQKREWTEQQQEAV